VALTADSGSDATLWQVTPDGAGHYRFANYGTGLVLAIDGMSKADGAAVVQWTDGASTSGCTATGARQTGKIGKALSFCNTNAYATLPTGAVSSLTGDYTISAWVNPASNASWQRVFDIGSSSNASMFLTTNDGAELRYAITTSGAGGEQRLNSTNPKTLPLNQWSLVTVTVAGTTGTLYVNGQVVATNTAMTIHPSAFGQSTRNYIGKSQYSGDPALNGTVDDLNVYNRALSADEVAALAGGQAGAGNVVHYAFDETGGTTLVDSSGNGRNGTVVAGTGSTGATTATDAATVDHFWSLTAVTAPDAPSGVAATADAHAVTVAWNAPADDGGSPVTGYRVYRAGTTDPVATVDAGTTSATITGIWPGDTAQFTVTAINPAGESDPSASTSVTVPDGATSVPGQGTLSNDNGWDTGLQDGSYNVVLNLWWGENGSIYKLYENGTLIATKQLTFTGVGAQTVTIPVTGNKNGTYVYTGQLINSKGTTATTSTTVKVTQANPGTPVLSNDNWDGDGTYTVTANMWWGTNATSYTFYENDVAVGQGTLTDKTPAAQAATLPVTGKAPGTYTYRVDFTNAAGTTTSTMTIKVTK
jgi:hypothetical protein